MASRLQHWFAHRVSESIRWSTTGAALLIPGGLIATFLTYWILWLLILLGFGLLFNFSSTTFHVITAVFLAVIFVWQFTAGRNFEESYNVTRDDNAQMKVALAQASGNRMALLLDPEVASMFIRVVTLMFLMGPRMFGASVRLWRRAQRLREMDVSSCGRVVGLLMKAQSRVDVDDIASRFSEDDVMTLVQPLADVDGVVFLRKDDSLALTVAPRFVEDFAGWTGPG